MPASVVLGQPDFVSGTANQGGSAQANTLNIPYGVAYDPSSRKLIVSDRTNHRVLIYNSIPTTNNVSADVVIGQQNFTSSSANQSGSVNANTLKSPGQVAVVGGRLLIADSGNHRVLIYNSIPTTNNASADVVIGQQNFTSGTSNQGGGITAAANRLSGPSSVISDGTKLFISDGNHRVLIYNSIPTTNNASADVVIGQQNFTSSSANQSGSVGANTLNKTDGGLAVVNNKLFVADEINHRVLIYNSVPTTNNASADVVLGEVDFTTANSAGTTLANNTRRPIGIYSDGKRLFIATYNSARVVIYNSIPTTNTTPNDIIVGSTDNVSHLTANGMGNPNNLVVAEEKLIVTDAPYNRILIFTNTTSDPRLGISSIEGREEGKLRINGNIQVDGGLYNIWKLEASVNGGGYGGVSYLSNSTLNNSNQIVGNTIPVAGTFYHDFEPWFNNNGSKDDWLNDSAKAHRERGYTIKLKAYNNNTDTGQPLFYFTPFIINTSLVPSSSCHSRENGNPDTPGSPIRSGMTQTEAGMTDCNVILSSTPTITFSVNKYQRNELKENLDYYQVWVKPASSAGNQSASTDWLKYIDKIPIDFDLVKNYEDNIRRTEYVNNPGSGNGTYENNYLIATFSNGSSTLSVRKKGTQNGTLITLASGTYQVKVTSVDKHGHTQDTLPVSVTVKSSPNNKNNLAITSEWFPLQINRIDTSRLGILSNFNVSTESSGYVSTSVPLVSGIAFSGTRIILTVTDANSGATRTYTTDATDSSWSMTPTLYPTSLIDVSAESVDGKYTELATIMLTVGSN